MSSFTDGKPFVFTEEHDKFSWRGYKDQRTLRCQFCGRHFYPGDTVRWIHANGKGSVFHGGNFFACSSCDNPDTELLLNRAEDQRLLGERCFWWLMDAAMLPPKPTKK